LLPPGKSIQHVLPASAAATAAAVPCPALAVKKDQDEPHGDAAASKEEEVEEEAENDYSGFMELDGSVCLSGIGAGDGIIIPAWMAVPAATALVKHLMLINTEQWMPHAVGAAALSSS